MHHVSRFAPPVIVDRRTDAVVSSPRVAAVPTAPKPERTKGEQEAAIASYLRAEGSLWTQGPVSLPIYQERKSECMVCPFRQASGDEIGFCGKCGCGDRERARLSTKLWMPLAVCGLQGPLRKWGEAAGEGLVALARLPGGITGQARSVLKGMRQEAARRWKVWRRRAERPQE